MVNAATEIRPFRVVHPDGRIEVNFNRPQSLGMVSQAPIVVLQSGTQVGKTSWLVEWLGQEMARCGPGHYMFVSPTFPLMERKAIGELRERFVGLTNEFEHQPGYKRFISKDKVGDNPAFTIMLGSAVNPDSLESSTLKAVAIDEMAQSQFPRGAWEAIIRRVNVNRGRIAVGTTLYEVSSWYKIEVYDRWKAGDKRFEIIQADSIENPAFPVEAYEQARKDLPPWKFNMQYRGIFDRPTGLVYDCFDETTQVIDRFAIPGEWAHFVGHDFGPNNTAAIWLAQDPGTGLLYLHREYHQGGLSVGQHSEEFKRLSAGEMVRKRAGGSWGEEEARYAYTAAGWPIHKPDVRDVEAGIDRVYSFIARNSLFVFRDCTETLNELLTYTRKLDDNYETLEQIANKSRFHLMDSLRYICSSFPVERVRKPMENRAKITRGAPAIRTRGRRLQAGSRARI